MYYGQIKSCDVANGPGVRVSLFVSGCRNRCQGCFQPQTWDFTYGQPFTEETEQSVLQLLAPSYIAGLTVLGGEPFEPENQAVLLPFLHRVRASYPDKTVWVFTGYTLETLLTEGRHPRTADTDAMLSLIDFLVDGPFEQDKKNLMLRFRGSENQRLIDLPATLRAGDIVCI